MGRLDVKDWEKDVTTNLYKAGVTEDGQDYTAECYCVVLTRSDGFRLTHYMVWDGCEAGFDDEYGTPYFKDIRHEARENAEKLLKRVTEKGEINTDNWAFSEPVYGSPYYCKYCGI